MNKRIVSLLFFILFIGFVAVIDYPFVARLLNEKKQTAVTIDHQNLTNGISDGEKEQMREDAIGYNHVLSTGLAGEREIPFTDAEEHDPVYLGLLNVKGDGVMGVIDIPKIEVYLPIYHGTSNEVLEKGAGHLPGSSLPVGGKNTHACIAAHRGFPTKTFFNHLDKLEKGDIFYAETLGERLAYQIYDIEIVTPDVVDSLGFQKGKDLFTLITCTPYGVNSHRIYVHGSRIALEEAERKTASAPVQNGFWEENWWIVMTVILLTWMVVLLIWFNRKPEERGKKASE